MAGVRRLIVSVPIVAGFVAASGAVNWGAKYLDIAERVGLTGRNVYGGLLRKDYILETTGNGVAIFDSDGAGIDDVLFAYGTTLRGKAGEGGRLQPYRKDGKRHCTGVAAE